MDDPITQPNMQQDDTGNVPTASEPVLPVEPPMVPEVPQPETPVAPDQNAA